MPLCLCLRLILRLHRAKGAHVALGSKRGNRRDHARAIFPDRRPLSTTTSTKRVARAGKSPIWRQP
ncbi:MAG: hypothetical protein IJC63_08945 [Myxococcaceae bacterium]|nr:hypothetical protein [Myxococcaceae bacterium]